MSTIARPRTELVELTALLSRLGDVPLERIRLRYPLGEATEQDLIEHERTGRLAELIDGVIVEKPMGYYESRLAAVLISLIDTFASEHDLGIVLGEAGMVRVEGQVREPDVAFYSWSRFPGRVLPRGPVLGVPPDLSVEMKRKRGECFKAGTQLFWQVYPPTKAVRVYTDEDTFVTRGEDDTLDGGAVLPGFALPVRRWFDRAGTRAP
jgi:Uma2 family endonuclease